MPTQLFKLFKKSSDSEPFEIYPVKFKVLGDMSSKNKLVSSEYYEHIRIQKMRGGRQFMIMQDLLMLLTQDMIHDEDKVLLGYTIDDSDDVIESVVNSYVHSQYHVSTSQYKLLFTLYDASKDKTTRYHCQYLQRIKDRYYQVSIRSNGLVSFTAIDDFDEKDISNMDMLVKNIANYLERVY